MTLQSEEIVGVSSAFDFFKIMHAKNLDHLEKGERSHIQYYRGQADSEWGVEPSIQRQSLTSFEGQIVQEFIYKRPYEFKNFNQNRFNMIAKMQHHGLATRLIDMSTNPAIALFFACNKHFDKDGELFLFSTQREEILTPKFLNLIMKFYLEEHNPLDKQSLYVFCDNYWSMISPSSDEINKLFYFLFANEPMAAITELITERMVRQSSTFLIVPFKAKNEKWEKYIEENGDKCLSLYNYLKKLGETEYDDFVKKTHVLNTIDNNKDFLIKKHQDSKRYIIKACNKKKILNELMTIGIRESFIFPELEYEGKGIVDEYRYLTQRD